MHEQGVKAYPAKKPGERWDVIVEPDVAGVWAFHCHILSHAEGEHGMFGMVTALVVKDPKAV